MRARLRLGVLVFSAGLSLLLLWGVACASAHVDYTFTGSFGASGSGAGEMALVSGSERQPSSGVAVDSATGNVYVADTGNRRVDEFSSSGVFIRAWGWGVATGAGEFQICTTTCLQGASGDAPGEFESPSFVAVDDAPGGEGDVYVADSGDGLVTKFDAQGNLITSWGNNGPSEAPNGQLSGSNATPTSNIYTTVEGPFHVPFNGIATDSSGNLWVFDQRDSMFEFGRSSSFVNSWYSESAAHPKGIAVDQTGGIYLDGDFEQIEKFTTNEANSGLLIRAGVLTQSQELTTSQEGGIYPVGLGVDQRGGDLYVDADGASVERISPASCQMSSGPCVAAETFGRPQLSGGAALAVDSATGVVTVTEPGSSKIDVFTPEVPEQPLIVDQSISSVTSSSATFSASVNARGPETEYHFEYGTTSAYGQSFPIPEGTVGSGFIAQEINAHVQDLSAGTTYHYRVVAHNALGISYGDDATFMTQNVGASVLPDGREWELVTPAQKHGALFHAQSWGWPLGVEVDPFVAEASASGDAMIDLASQPTEAEPEGYSNEVSVLSTRGTSGWSSQVIAPPHKEGTGPAVNAGSEYRFFAEDLSHAIVLPFGNFTPLAPGVTEATPYLRTDYLDGDVEEHCTSSCYRPLVTSANTLEGVSFGEEEHGGCFLNAGCGPEFVDATPDAAYVVLGASEQLTSTPNQIGERSKYFYEWSGGQLQPLDLMPASEGGSGVAATEPSPVTHQLSDRGSVFFTYNGHLYLHDFAGKESVRLDVAQGVQEPTEGAAEFLYASRSGSRVIFRDAKQLTSSPGGGIYECRVVEASDDQCELELTGISGETLIGGSDDATYLYFKDADEKLVIDHYDDTGWTVTHGPFIGPQPISQFGSPNYIPIYRVSRNGLFLTFMSDEDLVGYDTRDAVSGQRDEEVYLYEADSNRLACVSCNPTGARPVGAEYGSDPFELVGGSFAKTQWEASSLPPWTKARANEDSVYQPRFLSDSGRLFFNSIDALVPRDVNGTQDVYEYEPAGVGDCDASRAGYSEATGGCISLVSSGSSPEESAFMDASETGGDVFFITQAKLVSEDFDNALDVYDARECTAESACYPQVPAAPPECTTGDACKVAPTPQPSIFGPTPSATFSGVGNISSSVSTVTARSLTRAQKLARALKGCKTERVRARRTKCERKARKQYGPPAKKSGGNAKHKKRG
jgi:hypothetical protein